MTSQKPKTVLASSFGEEVWFTNNLNYHNSYDIQRLISNDNAHDKISRNKY